MWLKSANYKRKLYYDLWDKSRPEQVELVILFADNAR